MPLLHQPLPDGPLDLIGDVHGELDALGRLLARLGCDPDKRTATRPLVFVGDLVDRGPDSPGVVKLVGDLVDAGLAWCVLGNHELNLLRGDRKEGNGWFFGHDDGHHDGGARMPFASVPIDPADRDRIRATLGAFPVVLSRPDLRVVHACWDDVALRALPVEGDPTEVAIDTERRVLADLEARGVLARAEAERQRFADLRDPGVRPTEDLPAVRALALAEQQGNPFRVLTSGREDPIDVADTFYVGGKWRLVDRARWWAGYEGDAAVVIGHYWRRRARDIPGKRDLWDDVPPFGWAGPRRNVFCVDYSVGRRFVERHRDPTAGRARPFHGGLAALRWPERTLVFDDRPDPVPTTGFGA